MYYHVLVEHMFIRTDTFINPEFLFNHLKDVRKTRLKFQLLQQNLICLNIKVLILSVRYERLILKAFGEPYKVVLGLPIENIK